MPRVRFFLYLRGSALVLIGSGESHRVVDLIEPEPWQCPRGVIPAESQSPTCVCMYVQMCAVWMCVRARANVRVCARVCECARAFVCKCLSMRACVCQSVLRLCMRMYRYLKLDLL